MRDKILLFLENLDHDDVKRREKIFKFLKNLVFFINFNKENDYYCFLIIL